MISIVKADEKLRAHVRLCETAAVPLADAAGRVLRESVGTDRDYPPFDRVAMDGIALAFEGLRDGKTRFRVAGTQAAGEPPHTLADVAACIEVMTGAALPEGCDTVVPYEVIHLENGTVTLRDAQKVEKGQNVHHRGTDARAGTLVLAEGTRIGPHHVAALASVGKATVRVAALPRLAVVTTGDELVEVEATPLFHQIRQSNGHAVRAALAQHGYGGVMLQHARDEAPSMQRLLEETLAASDVLILSGGVSAGRFDLVPTILKTLGVVEVFHKIRQKPGKPLWFGATANGQAVFGLPGNPVSALVCLYRYVLPFLARCAGAEAAPGTAVLTSLPRRKNDFTHFVPVRFEGMDAHPVPTNGSGDFLSVVASDGFAEVAPELTAPGPVPVFSWSPT